MKALIIIGVLMLAACGPIVTYPKNYAEAATWCNDRNGTKYIVISDTAVEGEQKYEAVCNDDIRIIKILSRHRSK